MVWWFQWDFCLYFFKNVKSDLNDSGQCHRCKNEENGFRFSEGLWTSLNLPKHSLKLCNYWVLSQWNEVLTCNILWTCVQMVIFANKNGTNIVATRVLFHFSEVCFFFPNYANSNLCSLTPNQINSENNQGSSLQVCCLCLRDHT